MDRDPSNVNAHQVDVLIVGGGMAGLATAASASRAGLSVLVVEKLPTTGGSAALSAGILWTAPDFETFARVSPEGDMERGRTLIDGFEPAVAELRDAGVQVSERWIGQMGFGAAYHSPIEGVLDYYRDAIAAAGNEIRTSTVVRKLVVDGDVVRGGVIAPADDPHSGGETVHAKATVIATGGFQGDAGLVKTLLGDDADLMPLRSNPGSTGDGFRMATAAGASASRCLGMFYGHLVPDRIDEWGEPWYLPLTQYHSHAAIVVNMEGRRFADESRGDEVTNQLALKQTYSRAYLIADERIRREYAVGPPYPHGQDVDRFQTAIDAGGRVIVADTIDEMIERMGEWGVDRAALRQTLDNYRIVAEGGTAPVDAPMPENPARLEEAPFYAVACRPALTFPYGGVRVDHDGRCLDHDGHPVPGLWCVGADAGGLQGPGYIGGLVLGLVFGPITAEAIGKEIR